MSKSTPEQGPESVSIVVDGAGQEWAGQFRLPPDNDEPWQQRDMVLTTDRFGWAGDTVISAVRTVTYHPDSSGVTNAEARASNLRLIEQGHMPLFVRPEDIPIIDSIPRQHGLFRNILSKIG